MKLLLSSSAQAAALIRLGQTDVLKPIFSPGNALPAFKWVFTSIPTNVSRSSDNRLFLQNVKNVGIAIHFFDTTESIPGRDRQGRMQVSKPNGHVRVHGIFGNVRFTWQSDLVLHYRCGPMS